MELHVRFVAKHSEVWITGPQQNLVNTSKSLGEVIQVSGLGRLEGMPKSTPYRAGQTEEARSRIQDGSENSPRLCCPSVLCWIVQTSVMNHGLNLVRIHTCSGKQPCSAADVMNLSCCPAAVT